MTDTTDTASLKKQIDTATDIIRDLIDKLEAERQRAEAVCRDIRIQANDLKSAQTVNKFLQATLAELKGKQVPVAITDDMAIAFHAATTDSALGRDDMEEIKAGLQAVQELFTAPQKPVVPMALFDGYQPHIVRELQAAFKMAIEAAGGIVRDGE